MALKFSPSIAKPGELMDMVVQQANKNNNKGSSSKKPSSSGNKPSSSSSSKKPSSSSNKKNNGVYTGNFYQDYQTRKTAKKKQQSFGAQLGKAVYDAQEEKLQNQIKNATDQTARQRYQSQLQALRDRANATLPGGIAGMEESERQANAISQRKEAREREERQSRIDELNDKLSKTTDRRARAAYRSEIKELQYPLSRTDQRQGYLTRDKIRDAKAAYDEGTQLIKDGFEEEGKKLQEAAHNAAEYYRALAGYSGGASGADRILPELTPMENRIFTQEGKTALRAAKSLYELGQKTGDDALMEQARQMGYNVRLTEEYKDPDAVYAERSREPTTKRVDAYGRPIYTPTEIEAEGMASFFPAVGYQIKGSIEALLEAARGATRETIQNRNNDVYQANQDNLAYWQRKARTAQTEEQKAQAEKNIQNLQELLDSQRAKVETPTWISSNALFDLHQAARLQELVQDSIRNPFGKLVNQAAMSALQMAPALAASAVGGPAVGAALMGVQAAGAKAGEVLESGGSATEALTRGLVSGGIEGVTERIPIGNLLRIVRGSGGASFLANMARQAGIEATEESASYTLNYLADLAARDPNAQFSLQDLAESAAVGAISGAGFGGFGSGLSAGPSARQNTAGQQAAQNQVRGVTRQTGTGAERLATQRAAQQVTQQPQQPTTQQAENPLLRSMQETRQEQERAAVRQNLEAQAEQITREANAQVETIRRQAARRPQSAQERVQQAAQAEAQARRPATLEEREADYQRRYQNYMQRAQEAAANPALQTPENYQALQNELAMDAGEVTEEQLRREFAERQAQMQPATETEDSPRRLLDVIRGNRDVISQNGVLMELTGNEFSDRTRRISEQVSDFFKSIGNRVTRLGFGDVALTRRGAKNSIAHGIGRNKAITFAAVPAVIEDGQIIDEQSNWKDRGYGSVTIGGRVKINGRDYDVGVVVRRDDSSTDTEGRYYLHEVVLTDEEGDPVSFWTGTRQGNSGDTVSPSTDSIQEEGGNVNGGGYSVGAAPSGFDPYSQMLNEYGAIPPGEKPARIVDVPRSTDGQDRVRQSARTFMEAEATPDELVDLFQQGVVNKEWSYNPKKDKASVDRAMRVLSQEEGFQRGLNQWNEMVSTGRQPTKDDIVMAQMIYKAAARAGDYETAGRLAGEIAALSTISAQNVQSMRLLKQATPEGKLFYIQKGVDQINKTMDQKYGDRFQGIDVPDELYQQYMNAETDEAQMAALDSIYDYVAERVPRTFGDALDTWRYFAMLGNPRTHIRNFLGNVIMQGPIQTRNVLSAGLQNALLPQEQRTRSVGANRAMREFARQDFEANKDILRGNPYTTPEGGEIMRRVREKGLTVDKGKQERSAFWRGVNTLLKPLQGAATANNNLMDFEDMLFKKSTYINSLSNFLKARGYDPSRQDIPENVLEEGRGQAIEDALESTFQNYSSLASKLAELENSSKAAKLVIGGLMPFKKTPINITKRSIEFSPFGLANGMIQWFRKVPKGEVTAAEALDNIAAGISGTGIAAIGAFLASQGLVNAGDDEDDRLRDFGVAQGSQEYSLNIGDHSFTIDWAAPSVIPLFFGVEAFNAAKRLMEEQGEDTDSPGFFTEAVNAISRMFEPMMNMTMLSGLSGAIQSAAYNQANPIIGIGSNVAQNFFGQFFPTLSGQIARTVDDTRRTTFYDATTDVPKGLQSFIQTQMNKIPGLSQRNPAWLDSWGREDKTENPLFRFLENFLSPGYIAERNTDNVDAELQRLYELGEEGMLPKNPEKSVEVDGKRLTADQWQKYAETKGSASREMLEGIISSPQYQELSDQDKAKVVRKVFEYGTYSGKEAIGADTSKFDSWYGKLIEGRDQHGISPVDYLTMYIGKNNIDNDESTSNQQQGMDVAAMIDSNDRLNEDQKEYLKENLKIFNFMPVDTGEDSKYQQAIDAGFTPEEAAEGYKIIEGAKAYGEDGTLDESEFERYMREKMGIEPGTEEYNKYLKAYGSRSWKSVKALIGDTTDSGHQGYTMNDERYSSAINAGFGEEEAKTISIGRQVADKEYGDGNGYLNKNELVSYIQKNYPQNQWKSVFSIVANSNWKNPFG